MHSRHSRSSSNSMRAAFIAFLLSVVCHAEAAVNDAQWKSPSFHTAAKNTRLAKVLQRFAKAQGLHLKISAGVDGRVTGKFNMPPEQMLNTLAARYDFSWRLDGRTLKIAPMTFATTMADPFNGNIALRNSTTMQDTTGTAPPVPTLAPADPALSPLKVWSTSPADKTLQNALARWSIAAGWQMFWELPQDYSVEAAASINGSFEDAITAVTNSLQQNNVAVSAIFFEGNRVLRIVARGAQ